MPYSKSFENKTEYSRKDTIQNTNQDTLSNLENNKKDQNSQLDIQNSTQSPFAALRSFWNEAVNGVSGLKTSTENIKSNIK
jgi:hypothetical protein